MSGVISVSGAEGPATQESLQAPGIGGPAAGKLKPNSGWRALVPRWSPRLAVGLTLVTVTHDDRVCDALGEQVLTLEGGRLHAAAQR